jgi:hypothetical protein
MSMVTPLCYNCEIIPARDRHVGRNRADAGFFQDEQEMSVARQSIELCDDKPRAP